MQIRETNVIYIVFLWYRSRILYGDDAVNAGKNINNDEAKETIHLSEEDQMKALLGFGGFDTTKGKQVDDNVKGAASGAVRKDTKREYRQYMNRRGGFNRPLERA